MGERRDLPMDYVRTALNPDEKIIHLARFHWFYDFVSWFWLFIGVMMSVGVLCAASAFVLNNDINRAFPNLPDEHRMEAVHRVIKHYGGWLGLFGDLHIGIKIASIVMLLWGVYVFAHRAVVKYTTEIAVTTVRLIYKRGVVARFVGEMKLDRLESVNVWQSFFGRIFNYGRVLVHGVGVGEVLLPEVEDPMKLRKALDYARTKLTQHDRKIVEDEDEEDQV